MEHYIVIEGKGRDTLTNCRLHGLFDTEELALAWANKYVENTEWHVASLEDIEGLDTGSCTFEGWSL